MKDYEDITTIITEGGNWEKWNTSSEVFYSKKQMKEQDVKDLTDKLKTAFPIDEKNETPFIRFYYNKLNAIDIDLLDFLGWNNDCFFSRQ